MASARRAAGSAGFPFANTTRPLLCAQEGTFLTSVFGFTVNWDRRNDPTFATRGFDLYFGTDVPNWPPYSFINDDRTVGVISVDRRMPRTRSWVRSRVVPPAGPREVVIPASRRSLRRIRRCSKKPAGPRIYSS